MALPSSGAISLNQMHTEVGGSSGTTASINDSDIRGLANKSSGAQMSFNEFHGLFYNQRSFTFTCGYVSFTPAGSKFPVTYHGWDPAGYVTGTGNTIGSGSAQYVRYNGNRIIRILACVANVGFINVLSIVFDQVNPAVTLNTTTARPTLATLLSLPSGYVTDSGNTFRYNLNGGSGSSNTYLAAGTTRYSSILNYRDLNFPNTNNTTGTLPSSGSVTLTFS
tara:strand:+ start:797 stop:1462 length:666 start_codon:yes stop_codon:yes gene_type:complete